MLESPLVMMGVACAHASVNKMAMKTVAICIIRVGEESIYC